MNKYERYLQRVEELQAKGYRIVDKNVLDEAQYETLHKIFSTSSKPSKNIPRDLARQSVTLSVKQVRAIKKAYPGMTHIEIRGLSLTEASGIMGAREVADGYSAQQWS